MQWNQRNIRKGLLVGVVLIVLPALSWAQEDDEAVKLDGTLISNSVTGPISMPGGYSQLLTTIPLTPAAPEEDSIWEELLMSLATKRDPRLIRLNKKREKLSGYIFSNILALNTLSAGQSIPFLAAPNKTLFARQVLGVSSSGVSILSTGVQWWMNRKYTREEKAALADVEMKVNHILNRLRQGDSPELVRLELDDLIGRRAGMEFVHMWNSVYTNSPPEVHDEKSPIRPLEQPF